MPAQIIDLSALYWRNWHASDGDEVSSARRKTLGFVRSLYGNGDVIVALDSPPYWRTDEYPEYKANRADRSEAAQEELKRCTEEILNDGWKVASAKKYEADDVIYTLIQHQYKDAVVYGSDKDLLQCCDVIEPWSRNCKTAENTLGVKRSQVVDFLTLIGDNSDNIPGVKGVGPKTAIALLDTFGSIEEIFEQRLRSPDKFKPSTLANLNAALEYIFEMKKLITLQDCASVLTIEQKEKDMQQKTSEETVAQETKPVPAQTAAITVQHDPVGFRQSLEPIGVNECYRISEAFFQSRLYSKFPTPQAIMVTIMRGRALGLDATTALDGINVIKGKPTMAASLMVGLVLASQQCEYLYCVDTTDSESSWAGKRKGTPEGIKRTFTMKDAERLELASKDNWIKQPAIMLKWRAATMIIRELFPDVINGLYATEEME
jgi:hypothetical protein